MRDHATAWCAAARVRETAGDKDVTNIADQALELAQWIRNVTAGKYTHVMVSELAEVEATLRAAAAELSGRAKKSKKRQPLTSRSKLNRRPDTAYLAFVRSYACIGCSSTDCHQHTVEAHHAGRKRDKGFGRKPSDDRCVPLGRWCHQFFHDHGHLPFLTPAEPACLSARASKNRAVRSSSVPNSESGTPSRTRCRTSRATLAQAAKLPAASYPSKVWATSRQAYRVIIRISPRVLVESR
jgi:hypothetical protein